MGSVYSRGDRGTKPHENRRGIATARAFQRIAPWRRSLAAPTSDALASTRKTCFGRRISKTRWRSA